MHEPEELIPLPDSRVEGRSSVLSGKLRTSDRVFFVIDRPGGFSLRSR